LEWLLSFFPTARSVLEVGCGTGHFTAWLAQQGLWAVGLDRAPAMLTEVHQRSPGLPLVLADAHCLPYRQGAVDLVAFVTTLEFLEEPVTALAEAARVARQGALLIVLNRWSPGGLSRRWGSQAHRPLLSQARDYSVVSLWATVHQATAGRRRKLHWTSTLFPAGCWRVRVPIPVGEVLGMAVEFTASAATPGNGWDVCGWQGFCS
jgi:ubiquinone/menaquinone biosynthesis C-methylase UbiE